MSGANRAGVKVDAAGARIMEIDTSQMSQRGQAIAFACKSIFASMSTEERIGKIEHIFHIADHLYSFAAKRYV